VRKDKAPIILIFIILIAAATIAVIDQQYRKDFYEFAGIFVAGFWGWMQPTKD
jgi:hypothetical protein